MNKFFEYLSTNNMAGFAFVMTLYLIMLYMVIEPGFKTWRDKGKKINIRLNPYEPAVVTLTTDRGASVKVSSEEKFVIEYNEMKIESKAFSATTHLATFNIELPGLLSLLQGDSADVEIEANNGEVESVVQTGFQRRYSSIIAATFLTMIVWFLYFLFMGH